MFCLVEIADIAWVIASFVLYSSFLLSALYCALFIIFKLIDYIRKELDL